MANLIDDAENITILAIILAIVVLFVYGLSLFKGGNGAGGDGFLGWLKNLLNTPWSGQDGNDGYNPDIKEQGYDFLNALVGRGDMADRKDSDVTVGTKIPSNYNQQVAESEVPGSVASYLALSEEIPAFRSDPLPWIQSSGLF